METPKNSVRLDILKCVQIFFSYKTEICIENVSRFSRSVQIFVTDEKSTDLPFGGKENVDTLENI